MGIEGLHTFTCFELPRFPFFEPIIVLNQCPEPIPVIKNLCLTQHTPESNSNVDLVKISIEKTTSSLRIYNI